MAGVAIVLLVALLFYRVAVHRPGWWVTAGDRSPADQTRRVATENGVVRELTRVRTAASWGFVLGEEDVNAWLVNRLEPWAESQGPMGPIWLLDPIFDRFFVGVGCPQGNKTLACVGPNALQSC